MDLELVAKTLAISSGFGLGAYNFVFSQNVMPHIWNQPASMTTPIFAKIYNVGASTILPVAATAITAYGYLAFTTTAPEKRKFYATSAALMLGTLPLTQLVMMPGIARLIETSKSATMQSTPGVQEEVVGLLKTWTRQNYFRSSLHMTAGLIGLVTALQ